MSRSNMNEDHSGIQWSDMQFTATAISAKNNGNEFSLHMVRNMTLNIQMLRIGVKCQKLPL